MADTLATALERHAIELPEEQVAELERYCKALWEWNEKMNLTRHTDYEKFVTRDVVDTLAFEQFLDAGERVLDVGSGGGVPGVPLAIVRPDLEVELSESVAKKAHALNEIVHTAGINVPVHHARAEEILERASFDTLVARAVAPLDKLLTWVGPHWDAFGQLLIIKGPAWIEERKVARERGLLKSLDIRKLAEYPLPGTENQSVVLAIRPKGRGAR